MIHFVPFILYNFL